MWIGRGRLVLSVILSGFLLHTLSIRFQWPLPLASFKVFLIKMYEFIISTVLVKS